MCIRLRRLALLLNLQYTNVTNVLHWRLASGYLLHLSPCYLIWTRLARTWLACCVDQSSHLPAPRDSSKNVRCTQHIPAAATSCWCNDEYTPVEAAADDYSYRLQRTYVMYSAARELTLARARPYAVKNFGGGLLLGVGARGDWLRGTVWGTFRKITLHFWSIFGK